MVGATGSDQTPKATTTKLTFDASTGNLSATLLTGTLTTAAQPNITSFGTIAALIAGNINAGNLYIAANANVAGLLAANTLQSTAYSYVSVLTGITAAGTTQGTGTALTKAMNVVDSVTTGANSVVLPVAVAGSIIYITNTNANALNVFPASGAKINTGLTNIVYVHSAGATLAYISPSTTQWYTVGGTYA